MQDYTPPPPKKKGMWPLLGLMMAVAAGLFAYVIGPRLIPVVRQITNGAFTGQELPPDQMRLAFMVITFIIIIAFAGFILTLFIPRKKSRVKETDLRKSRELNIKEEKRRRMRARYLEHQTRKQNKRIM
jgi:hypothetical protein